MEAVELSSLKIKQTKQTKCFLTQRSALSWVGLPAVKNGPVGLELRRPLNRSSPFTKTGLSEREMSRGFPTTIEDSVRWVEVPTSRFSGERITPPEANTERKLKDVRNSGRIFDRMSNDFDICIIPGFRPVLGYFSNFKYDRRNQKPVSDSSFIFRFNNHLHLTALLACLERR